MFTILIFYIPLATQDRRERVAAENTIKALIIQSEHVRAANGKIQLTSYEVPMPTRLSRSLTLMTIFH